MQCISKNKLNRLKNRSFNIRVLFLLCWISITSSGQASVDKITSSTPIQLLTPSTPIPESFLLDVGIPTFNDGLYLTDDDDLVFPEVRYAESIYFANQLAKVLERSGAWGAVRVIPNDLVITDVFVKAIILHSDGEKMSLEVSVSDISGKIWFTKKYQKVAGKLAYDRKMKASLGDPFQNVFTQIANDMLMTRENLANKNVQDLRNISELKFAEKFSPDAFSNYMTTNKKGFVSLTSLPSENDTLLERVRKIRQRDYVYIDTMQDYYDSFSQQMHFAYQDYRTATYDSVVRSRQLDRQGNRRIVAGIGSILAGIYGRTQAETRLASDAGAATAAVGGFILKSGLEKKQQAASFDESIAEMGSSLESEIAPQVIALEDRTITLTGTVKAQYDQWQKLMEQIYIQERGSI